MKHKVILAMGSNSGQEANIRAAIAALRQALEDVSLSGPIWTEPIGMESDRFLNCAMAATTGLGLRELTRLTKEIERQRGRNEADSRAGRIALDIDIMKYDSTLLHPRDWEREYMKRLIENT